MNKIYVILLSWVVCMTATAQTNETLFDSPFSTSNGDRPYRIPAIVQTSDDDILVFSDKRYCGGDVGQISSTDARIDLVYRRWNGTEWEAEKTIIEGKYNYGYGDVAVVADRENPAEIVFFCAAGNVFFTNGQLKCHRFRSSDGGVSWTDEGEISSGIYSAVGSSYKSAFFSSGRICQSSQIKVGTHYRLYAALCVTGTNSIVIYSDDFGNTWTQLGGVAVDGGNEAKCEELPNGSVLVSSRAEADRYFNVFTYTDKTKATGSWGSQSYGNLEVPDLSSQSTNGEILIVPAINKDGNLCNIALQSMPYGAAGKIVLGFIEKKNDTRTHVSIYYKELSADANTSYASSDFFSGWTRYQITSKTSAYSSMTWQADGNIGFVWEDELRTLVKEGYDIKYKNLSLSTITNSNYTNVQAWNMSKVPSSCVKEWCNGSTYSTLYLPYGVKLPEGVKAFTGTVDGDVLTIHELEGGVVPAMTAVLLEDEEKREEIDLTMVNTSVRVKDNVFEGTLTDMTVSNKADYLVMGHGSKHIGFYRPNNTTLKANRVFIPKSKVNVTSLAIKRGDATVIEDINADDTDAPYYDLMGHRVTNPTKGIYIRNGKKVMIK